MTTIVVGTDSSSAADLAVDDAARLASRPRGGVARAARQTGRRRACGRRSRSGARSGPLPCGLERRYPEVTTSTRIERGEPAERICEVAAEVNAETIVLGNRGTRGSWWRV